MKYIASVSFGKDSLAMLLMLIEKQYQLDEVIFYDTGMEFKGIYDILDRVSCWCCGNKKEIIELISKKEVIKYYKN